MGMPDSTDPDLLLRFARSGDREALGILFQRHAGYAYRTALTVLGDPGMAEDAVQEAFLKVMRSAGSFDPGRPLRPWLKTLVIRTAMDRLRAERRRTMRESGAGSRSSAVSR